MKILLFTFLLSGFISCSGSKSTSNLGEEETGIELADSDEFLSETPAADVVADNMVDPIAETAGFDETMPTDTAPVISEMGGQGSYTVQKNETLMIIAFKLFGDYGRWKEIAAQNGGIREITEGMTLNYNRPAVEFVWQPAGNPYLIKGGDTLGSISDTTYGTTKHWKDIWNNNKPLIKDPNRIFIGFTIFTPQIEGRDVANQMPTEL